MDYFWYYQAHRCARPRTRESRCPSSRYRQGLHCPRAAPHPGPDQSGRPGLEASDNPSLRGPGHVPPAAAPARHMTCIRVLRITNLPALERGVDRESRAADACPPTAATLLGRRSSLRTQPHTPPPLLPSDLSPLAHHGTRIAHGRMVRHRVFVPRFAAADYAAASTVQCVHFRLRFLFLGPLTCAARHAVAAHCGTVLNPAADAPSPLGLHMAGSSVQCIVPADRGRRSLPSLIWV